MAEQGTHKPLVVGSNPSLATPSPRIAYAGALLCGAIDDDGRMTIDD